MLFASIDAIAGSRGFVAILIDIGDGAIFDSKTYAAYLNGYLETAEIEDCWRRRATGGENIALTIRKKLPPGITPGLASAIWEGDQNSIRKAQEIMTNSPRELSGGKSIDGMHILMSGKGKISAMGLGARGTIGPKNPSEKLTIPWNDADPAKSAADLSLLLCKVSKPLDFKFSP